MSSLDLQYEKERTKRMFIQTLGALGGVDQSFADTDFEPINPTGQYLVYGQNAGYAREGLPVSEGQVQSLMPILLAAGLAFIVFKLVR